MKTFVIVTYIIIMTFLLWSFQQEVTDLKQQLVEAETQTEVINDYWKYIYNRLW